MYYALVAQLAEHIHGKDKVISSILIEGYILSLEGRTCKSAALCVADLKLGSYRGKGGIVYKLRS